MSANVGRAIVGTGSGRERRSSDGGSFRSSRLISSLGSGFASRRGSWTVGTSAAGRSAVWNRSRNASRLAGAARCSLSPSNFSSSARASAAVANAVRGSSCSARPSQPRRPGGNGSKPPRDEMAHVEATTSPRRAGYSSSRIDRPSTSDRATMPICATSTRWSNRGRFVVFGTAIRKSCQ